MEKRNPIKILFADDDVDIRHIVPTLLENDGFEVVEAVNGKDAVEKADESFDLIILDMMMPYQDGISVCVELRKSLTVPILFLSAKSQDSDKTLGLGAGGDAYLSKPWSYAELVAQVKAMIRRYHVYRGKESIEEQEIIKIKDLEINPSGRFVTGGPTADTGLTGRKIMVDTYGGLAAHGGGAFSGKDPSKVDRSAAYMARYIAKNYVKAEICSECSVSLSYAIGKAKPVMVQVTSHGTSEYSDEVLTDFTQRYFNLKPAAIIEYLDLRKPKYRRTARYGHFSSFIYLWERTFDSFKIKEALEEYAD